MLDLIFIAVTVACCALVQPDLRPRIRKFLLDPSGITALLVLLLAWPLARVRYRRGFGIGSPPTPKPAAGIGPARLTPVAMRA